MVASAQPLAARRLSRPLTRPRNAFASADSPCSRAAMLLLLLRLGLASCACQTHPITGVASCTCCDVSAIEAVLQDGDTTEVVLDAGTYNLGQTIQIERTMVIRAADGLTSADVILDGGAPAGPREDPFASNLMVGGYVSPLISVVGGSFSGSQPSGGSYGPYEPLIQLKNLTVQNGAGNAGGGGGCVKVTLGELRLDGVLVQRCYYTNGGGIYVAMGKLTTRDTVIRYNYAKWFGGGLTTGGFIGLGASTVSCEPPNPPPIPPPLTSTVSCEPPQPSSHAPPGERGHFGVGTRRRWRWHCSALTSVFRLACQVDERRALRGARARGGAGDARRGAAGARARDARRWADGARPAFLEAHVTHARAPAEGGDLQAARTAAQGRAVASGQPGTPLAGTRQATSRAGARRGQPAALTDGGAHLFAERRRALPWQVFEPGTGEFSRHAARRARSESASQSLLRRAVDVASARIVGTVSRMRSSSRLRAQSGGALLPASSRGSSSSLTAEQLGSGSGRGSGRGSTASATATAKSAKAEHKQMQREATRKANLLQAAGAERGRAPQEMQPTSTSL